MSAELKVDFTGLHNLVRMMDTSGKFVVKVGIFGNKNSRENTAPKKAGKTGLRRTVKGSVSTHTNAEIGLIHEVGSIERKIPQRSFLRMPVTVKSKQIIAGTLKDMPALLAKGDIRKILARLGLECQKWIQIAFSTRGFGTWLPDNISTIDRKGSNFPLIDTSQLRRSIISKVDER